MLITWEELKKFLKEKEFFVQPYPEDYKTNISYKSLFKNSLNFMPDASSLSQSSVAVREIIGRIIYRSF